MYRIQIIEDDPIMQKMLRDTLKPEGYEVVICGDGASGLLTAAADKPDLILLDINLPDTTGMDVCRTLKADPLHKHIPIIMMTGEAREVAQKIEGLDLGAEEYLLKPFSPRVLTARVKQILQLSTKP